MEELEVSPDAETTVYVRFDADTEAAFPMLVSRTIDSYRYVGYLRFWDLAGVSSQEFCVPVLATYSSDGLLRAAAVTSGSPWTNDFCIMGSAYDSVFAVLPKLNLGDRVEFVTVDGLVFSYSVVYLGNDAAEGGYAMTLTTTYAVAGLM